MPERSYRFSSLITRLVLLSLASVALALLRPASRARTGVPVRPRRRSRARRIAVSLSFATLFFAGASFSAGAGDVMVELVEDQVTSAPAAAEEPAAAECTTPQRSDWDAEDTAGHCPAEQTAEAPAPTEAPPATEAPVEPPSEAPAETPAEAPAEPAADQPSTADLVEEAVTEPPAAEPAEQPAASPASLAQAVRGHARKARPASKAPRPKIDRAPPVIAPRSPTDVHATKPDPEIEQPNTSATIWLHQPLPDPTPPSKRLTRRFAKNLTAAARKHRVDWALMLGVLRARGERGSAPSGKAGLNRLAKQLVRLRAGKNAWSAALALEGKTAFADRAIALTRYHKAVGLQALVRGLEWATPHLTKRLLRDEKVSIYSGGRSDLAEGRIDIRVIVLIRYLRVAHGQITITSLTSGHRFFSRPGVVSAHTYGQAVDIAALGGQSIMGHQLPGSITEEAVRNLLLLPAEVRPVQVISLLGLGGPSFPMADHDDHIHAGF